MKVMSWMKKKRQVMAGTINFLMLTLCFCSGLCFISCRVYPIDTLSSVFGNSARPVLSFGHPVSGMNSQADLSQDAIKPESVLDLSPLYQALEEMRQGRTNQGIQDLIKLGEEGNAEAFFHLGEVYALGAGRIRSAEKAIIYYRLAATSGHQRAELSLANLLYFEKKGKAEREEAIEIYRRYAILGEPEALYVLGLIYWNGETGQMPDPIRGFGMIARAADMRYERAIEAELAMISQISLEDRLAAKDFAASLNKQSFEGGVIPLVGEDDDFLVDTVDITQADGTVIWGRVWHLEVGVTNSRAAALKLSRQIAADMYDDIAGLTAEIMPMKDNARFRLIYGPMENFQDSVLKCHKFKQNGYDCFTRAPR